MLWGLDVLYSNAMEATPRIMLQGGGQVLMFCGRHGVAQAMRLALLSASSLSCHRRTTANQ